MFSTRRWVTSISNRSHTVPRPGIRLTVAMSARSPPSARPIEQLRLAGERGPPPEIACGRERRAAAAVDALLPALLAGLARPLVRAHDRRVADEPPLTGEPVCEPVGHPNPVGRDLGRAGPAPERLADRDRPQVLLGAFDLRQEPRRDGACGRLIANRQGDAIATLPGGDADDHVNVNVEGGG